jgi:hypothetical protein
MHADENTRDSEHARHTEQTILGALLVDRLPWSVAEVERDIGNPQEVKDALWSLQAAGLIHRCGDFAWPTRTAREADEIEA